MSINMDFKGIPSPKRVPDLVVGEEPSRAPFAPILSETLRHDLPIGVAVVGADSRIKAIDLTGLGVTSEHAQGYDGMIGRSIIELELWDTDAIRARVEEAIAWAQLGETHIVEVATASADQGRAHHKTITVRISPHDEGAALLFQDVTGWADDREASAASMEELNHRVKNMLTLVASIVNLNLRRASSIEDAQERIHKRLTAYGRSQDLVFRKGLDAAELSEIVRFALEPFSTERLDLDIPPCPIPARMAVTLNLALHELALNATKYGAWSNTEGRVIVTAKAEPANAQTGTRSFELVWKEVGGPEITNSAPTKGFGSVLTSRVIASQFNGTSHSDYAVDGLVWTLNGDIRGDVAFKG